MKTQNDRHMVIIGSEAAHFESIYFRNNFLQNAPLHSSVPSTAIVILNVAKRSEGSYKVVYQLYTELVISKAA